MTSADQDGEPPSAPGSGSGPAPGRVEPARPGSPPGRPVSLLLVEDHDMVLHGMILSLATDPGLDVAAVATSLAEARAALSTNRVDVIVTDLQLGDGAGTELVADAGALDPAPPVILITGTDERRAVNEALAAGCAGFVGKGHGFDRLRSAIHAVAAGAAVFPAELLSAVMRNEPTDATNPLSARELEVLQLLARAFTANEIATELSISEHTVRNHIRQILTKLSARSQLEAVVVGARIGIVTII